MISRILILICLAATAGLPPRRAQAAQAAPSQPAGSEADKQAAPFRWLDASGETAGVRIETRLLERISLLGDYGTSSEADKEVASLGSDGSKTTIRVFDKDPNGSRQLVETVVEEVRNLPGGRTEAARTVSRRDANGRLRVVRKATQETAPAGAGSYQTRTILLLPGSAGALEPVEQLLQKEQVKGENEVEVDRIRMLRGPQGSWNTSERRVGTSRKAGGQISTEEAVYRYDANGNLQLGERVGSREWKDAQGNDHKETTTYRSELSGRLELESRVLIRRETSADGTRSTTQSTEQRNPAAPSQGLRLVETVTEMVRAAGASGSEREVHVQAPDANGQTRSVYYQRTLERK